MHEEPNSLIHVLVKSWRLTGQVIGIGLELRQLLDPGINGTRIVIGAVLEQLIDAELISCDGLVNHVAAGTMAAGGLDSHFLRQFTGRLTYGKAGIEPRELVLNK